jgi:hypothetical protein
MTLKEGSRIKLGDCDVTTKYDKEKKTSYTNFKVFSFDDASENSASANTSEPETSVDDGEVEGGELPF